MSVWIQNLQMALETKPVVIVNGNVRDHYIDGEGVINKRPGEEFGNLTFIQSLCFATPVLN